MRPIMLVEHGKAESNTTVIRVSGQRVGSSNLERKANEVSESFHDPGQLCLHQMMQPSSAKQIVPVTKTVCNHPLYMAFCKSAFDGC
ncbi:hypothetical protein PF008_g4098 [Phytophthora fragariae]|uniref:Uncharacterized protein n=1 Tax=Phytophthora fragariae TaxID=53985 RepID=A0A6G0SCH4_9STRA|nr:hypothetical protein PF008_g4098 [Phytophthora fragariae]